MAAVSPPAPARDSLPDSGFDPGAQDDRPAAGPFGRWIGWRRRLLVAVALLGCLGIFALARVLAGTPSIDAAWTADAQGRIVLAASAVAELAPLQGRVLRAVGGAGAPRVEVDAALLHRSPRWQVSDAARQRQIAQHTALAALLARGPVVLHFEGDRSVALEPAPRGVAGLGLLFWPLAGLALVLLLFGAVVVLARPAGQQALFALMAASQTANLLLIAIESTRGLGLPAGIAELDLPLRLVLDLITAAAAVHALALHPVRLARAAGVAAAAWITAATGAAVVIGGVLQPAWWWAQGLCLLLGLAAWATLSHAGRLAPDARVLIMRRFSLLALATLLLATVAVAVGARLPGLAHGIAAGASVAWYLFLASLMLLTPFLARSRRLLREFALLAGISTVAASVDLLFVAVFSVGAFTSLAVAVFVALAVYAAARQVLLQRLLGSSLLTTERTFEHLYRAAREVQSHPDRHARVLGKLLRELFEPLELLAAPAARGRSRVQGGGAALLVPMREGAEGQAGPTLLLRHAQRGQRLFTPDDARLADRMVDQLRRAQAYDRAVERGRAEERQRIAQDLHDDIGARLLTLMYQAQTPEMEDYIRHTLQDLKTLTRGLAAAEHRLSDAAAEWKADLGQRLAAARAELAWSLQVDQDLRLSVVQWSGLTRVLRELVSNALFHGHATRIEVQLQLQGGRLALTVADDGEGGDPQAWSHGLGLGGVRKRVKLMGGQVAWRRQQPRGIVCEVRIEGFDQTLSTPAPGPR